MTPEQIAALNVRNDMIGVCFWVIVGLVLVISAIDYIQSRRKRN